MIAWLLDAAAIVMCNSRSIALISSSLLLSSAIATSSSSSFASVSAEIVGAASAAASASNSERASVHSNALTLGNIALSPGSTASRSEEHTSELQSLMRISYDVSCLIKNTTSKIQRTTDKTN